MSDTFHPDDWPPQDRDDLIAAEYVLGVLPLDERLAAQQRAELDGAFAERVGQWERRLAILNDAYDEGPVADLLPQIEARLFASPPPRHSSRGWLAGWLGGGLVAALLVVMALLFWPQPQPGLQARLAAGDLVFNAAFDGAVLQIAHSGPQAAEGHDYQLWAIGADGVPHSLGLLRGATASVTAPLEPGVTLAVSLEPLGGAPGVLPTGPVLVSAVLAAD